MIIKALEITIWKVFYDVHVKLITSDMIPAQFKVLVTKYLITAEVIVNLLNLNIVNFKAAGEAQLKMIKYDIDYQLFNGRVIVGLCDLWMLPDLVKVHICRHSLFHSLPWSSFLVVWLLSAPGCSVGCAQHHSCWKWEKI